MKILVLAEGYPMPGVIGYPMYIHLRNLYYISQGAKVTVLNFTAKQQAMYEGIKVITWKDYATNEKDSKYDLLVSHAPNLKHHYRFIQKYGGLFPHYVFIFHGHEVLRVNKVYPPLFFWKKQSNKLIVIFHEMYDIIKLRTWKHFFEKRSNINKSNLVFVSQWMLDEFLKNTHTCEQAIIGRTHIIYNSVGSIFEKQTYQSENIEYDFVTIRQNIDGEKYCVDVVNSLAKHNPQYRFLVVGRGVLFNHTQKADNLIWLDIQLTHQEISDVLNKSRSALMLTKTDAQGLMMCEMATYGIPVVTSDIPVCHEVLDSFSNVAFISNRGDDDLQPVIERLEQLNGNRIRNNMFFEKNTSGAEYKLFKLIVGEI